MLSRFSRLLLVTVVVLLLAVAFGSVAYAQEPQGTGPEDALLPGDWRAIAPGEKQWYMFTYDYDKDFVDPIGIYLFVEPEDRVMFTVRTPEQVEDWIMDGDNNWVGCCAENDFTRGDRSWSGYFMNSGTYYVVVEPMGGHNEVAYYRLEIDGDNVFFPEKAAMAMAEPAAAPEPAAPEAVAPQAAMPARGVMGTGPDDAFAFDGAWHKLEMGERHWYAFNFDYDDEFAEETVDIFMRVEPDYGALFTVRTPEQAQTWRDDGEHEFMGCCAENEFAAGDFSWAGALPESGMYYVVVEHSRIHPSDTIYYSLGIDGKNIDLALPAPVKAPAAAQAMMPEAEVEIVPGMGPDDTLAFDGEWRELLPGQEHWYSFNFQFDEDVEEPIQIGMYVGPEEEIQEIVYFTVRTPENITLWRDEGEVEFIGCCSDEEFGLADLSWAGKFAESGTYYVVVEHNELRPENAYYRLVIDGKNVSPALPTPVVAPALAPEAAMPEEVVMEYAPGIGPDDAFGFDGEWRKLDPGQEHWYTFNFRYDEDVKEPVQIGMYVGPEEEIQEIVYFTVRTPENITLWRDEGEVEFIGCCSDEEFGLGDLSWAGKFAESGTYYVVVEHNELRPDSAYYRLVIDGETVAR